LGNLTINDQKEGCLAHAGITLYLSQKLAEIDDPARREELLQAMAHGSAARLGASESLARV
jgi:predicted NAD-dependent protein-ADP-ribosyltransferase YbiA (DUF1768 family)